MGKRKPSELNLLLAIDKPPGRLAIRPAAGGGRPFPHTYERTAWESASPAN